MTATLNESEDEDSSEAIIREKGRAGSDVGALASLSFFLKVSHPPPMIIFQKPINRLSEWIKKFAVAGNEIP